MHQLEKEKRLQEGRPLNRRERMQTEMQEQEGKEEKEGNKQEKTGKKQKKMPRK